MHQLKKLGEEIFLDRDGKIFEILINYLRNGRQIFPSFTDLNMEILFLKELHFWGIDEHNLQMQENIVKKMEKS